MEKLLPKEMYPNILHLQKLALQAFCCHKSASAVLPRILCKVEGFVMLYVT